MAGLKGPAVFLLRNNVTMKKLLLALALLSCHAANLSAQKNVVASQWKDFNITIDGHAKGWPTRVTHEAPQTKICYSIANDAENLYIYMHCTDKSTISKILRAGIDLWIDTKGGRKKTCAIHYPLLGNATIDMPHPDEDDDKDKQKKTASQGSQAGDKKELSIQGMLNIPDRKLPLENLLGINVALSANDDTSLDYELKIPFGLFMKETLNAADTTKLISIGISINGLTLPPPPGMDGPPDGGGMGGGPPGGGMGGPPGGGGDMGGPPPGMAAIMELTRSQEDWIRLRPAFR
jgi:hypothetical protein